MTRKARMRLYAVLLFLAGFGTATGLTLFALRDNLSYFRTPSELVSGHYPEHATGRAVRLGGLVEKGSITRSGVKDGQEEVTFRVTDLAESVTVHYRGIVPDLFRDGQGIIALGKLQPDGSFAATQLLAKHDEKYMPPEVAKSLRKPGNP